MNEQMPKRICVDFDGVLHRFDSGWQGADQIPDLPVDGAIEGLHRLCDDPEIEVAIYSSRSSDPRGIQAMKEWLAYWEGVWREENQIAPNDGRWLTERCKFPIAIQINLFLRSRLTIQQSDL